MSVRGTYHFSYSTNNAISPCSDQTYSIVIVVNDCDCPSVAIDTAAPDLCNNETGLQNTLNLNDFKIKDENGTWQIINTPNEINGLAYIEQDSIFIAVNADAGIYEVIFLLSGQVLDGCPEQSQTLYIEVYKQETASLSSKQIELCNDQTDTISLNDFIIPNNSNGVWTIATNSPNIPPPAMFDENTASVFPANVEEGSYLFQYTLPTNFPCKDTSLFFTVSIFEKPKAGTGSTIDVCNSDNTPIDLFSLLNGYDTGGIWTIAGTSIDQPDAGTFDAINATFTSFNHSAGSYTFTYKVTGFGYMSR